MAYLLAALLGGFFVFNAKATPDKAARVIQSTLQRQFATQNVRVEVEGKRGRNVLKGRFRRVRVAMNDFQLPVAPVASNSAPSADNRTQNGATVPNDETVAPSNAVATGSGGLGFSLGRVARARSEGRVELFELALRDFAWNGLPVSRLDMSLRDVAFDWKSLRKNSRVDLVRCGASSAHLSLDVAALEPFLKAKLQGVSGAKLQLLADGNRVRVEGSRAAPLLDIAVPFVLNGRLGARNGNEIWLESPSISLGGLPAPAPLTRALLGDLNPIYVFDAQKKTPFRVQIQSLQSNARGLKIAADLRFVPAQ